MSSEQEQTGVQDLLPSSSNESIENVNVKTRWESSPPSEQCPSPSRSRTSAGSPVQCSICLGQPENKSFTDKCFHEFCFTCLLEWSKVKAECPLCKQAFNRIIHSVQSMDQYEEYQVPEERHSPDPSLDDPWALFGWHHPAGRFRYRTTVADPESRRRMAIERRLRHFHYQNFVIPSGPRPMRPRRRPHTTGNFRRLVYEDNMWSQLMPDVTGLRESSPRFFRENPAMTHRLVPWLNRELSVLITPNNDPQQIQNLIEMILELIKTQSILSPDFRRHMEPHVGGRAKHFQHEFYTFARSPYDVAGYDQNVQFVRREAEETEDSGSEIEVLEEIALDRSRVPRDHVRNDLLGYMPTTSRSDVIDRVLRLLNSRTSPQPGPSGARNSSPHSWGSSDSEITVVATMKPKRERTPVLIDLSSDEQSTPTPVEEPVEMKKSKNGERLKRMMRQQLESATASAASTPDVAPGPSRRRIASSDSDSGSVLMRMRREKKRSYRKSDYDSSDSDFDPERKTKSPRRISEEPDSSDSEVDRKRRKKHKRNKDGSKKERKEKHKRSSKHKKKRSKDRSSKASESSSSRSHSSKSKRDKESTSSKESRSDER